MDAPIDTMHDQQDLSSFAGDERTRDNRASEIGEDTFEFESPAGVFQTTSFETTNAQPIMMPQQGGSGGARAPDVEGENLESSAPVGVVLTTTCGTTIVQYTGMTSQPQVPRDLNAFIGTAPEELKCEIMYFHCRATWVKRCVLQGFYREMIYGFGDNTLSPQRTMSLQLDPPASHRAMILQLTFNNILRPWAPHNVGWVAMPLYVGRHKVFASTIEEGIRKVNMATQTPALRFADYARDWDAFQPWTVMRRIAQSKFYYQYIRRMFFRRTTWVFNHKCRIYDVVENPACRLSYILGDLRSICLEIGNKPILYLVHPQFDPSPRRDEWSRFLRAFEYLLDLLLRSNSPLRGITSFELHGQNFNAKLTNAFNQRVLDEKIRIRYLATRCYQLVRARPDIKIVLSGRSLSSPTKEVPRLPGRQRTLRYGLGYSEEDMARFFRSVSVEKFPSLEVVLDVNESVDDVWYGAFAAHFQCSFVEEWKKIWELGVANENNIGGYQGVQDPKVTKTIYDETEIDSDNTSPDSEYSEDSDDLDDDSDQSGGGNDGPQ